MITMLLRPDHGEPFEMTATSRDVFMWEKTNKGKTFEQFQRDVSIVDCYEIAWHACRRQGLFTGKLDEFVTSFDLEWDEKQVEDPGPFPQDLSAEPSSGSRSTQGSRRASGSTKAKRR